jgi:REP element-mobilizing transposase RayT
LKLEIRKFTNVRFFEIHAGMARAIRVAFEGAVYHVMARGNERREIFRDDTDRKAFLSALGEMVERFGVLAHAYCLMPNHYHLVVQTPRANLSQAVGWLQVTYTVRFNRRWKRSGHLFQGRYKAQLVDGKPLPNSIAPGKVSSDIAVTINQLDAGEKVQFVVVDSGLNPSQKAKIESTSEGGDTLTQNGTIKIKGLAQTDPGMRNKLKIAARIVKNGQPGRFLWTSQPFAVCAHPINFVLNGIYDNNTSLKFGMAVRHRWDSDAAGGDVILLGKAWLKEKVSERSRDNPPWLQGADRTGDWFGGNGTAIDTHSIDPGLLKNPPPNKGKIINDQYEVFACDRCGIQRNDNAPKIPNSDFVITRDCDTNQKNEYVVQTIKDGPGAPAGGLKSAVEAGQPPKPPTGMTIVMAIQNGDQTFTITWTDNSDIEEGIMRWRWSKALNDWVRVVPDLAPNVQQDTVSFSGQPFQSGDVFKYRLRIYNWRKNPNDASEDVEKSFSVP